jgi:hypothetical protein
MNKQGLDSFKPFSVPDEKVDAHLKFKISETCWPCYLGKKLVQDFVLSFIEHSCYHFSFQ